MGTSGEYSHDFVLRLPAARVINCAFDRWYPLFESRKKFTISSTVVDLPDSFISYLNKDGVVLPEVPEGMTVQSSDPRHVVFANEDTYEVAGDVVWEDEEDELSEPSEKFCFPELEQTLHECISKMNGEIFVKLNWSSPQDAAWVSGSLKCSSPGDVYMLLKSSDFIQYDLCHPYDNCYDYSANTDSPPPRLIARKWSHLNKGMEFRCFVVDNALVGIAQRYVQQHYPFLALSHQLGESVYNGICDFFYKQVISDTFPEDTFTFDVYVDRKSHVWLLDFNPLAQFVVFSSDDEEDNLLSCSKRLLSTPPHELLSWRMLYDLSKSVEEDEDFLPAWLVTKTAKEAESYGDVKRSHRVPIELVTGELTQDIVDQAKKQLNEM